LRAFAKKWCGATVRASWRCAVRDAQPRRLRRPSSGQEAAGVQAYIVPSEDPHQSEYAAACYERRQFISRFTVRLWRVAPPA
jgi:hypothetical protein